MKPAANTVKIPMPDISNMAPGLQAYGGSQPDKFTAYQSKLACLNAFQVIPPSSLVSNSLVFVTA